MCVLQPCAIRSVSKAFAPLFSLVREVRKANREPVMPSWNQIRQTFAMAGIPDILTATVLYATGRNSRFGIYWRNTVSVPIRVTSWVLGDAVVSSASSGIATSSLLPPVSVTNRQTR